VFLPGGLAASDTGGQISIDIEPDEVPATDSPKQQADDALTICLDSLDAGPLGASSDQMEGPAQTTADSIACDAEVDVQPDDSSIDTNQSTGVMPTSQQSCSSNSDVLN
jgi:hypothetical protein